MDGRDIAEDFRCKLDEMPKHHKPRFYKFRVEYMERQKNGLGDEKVGEGEIMLIVPRHPDEGGSNLSVSEFCRSRAFPNFLAEQASTARQEAYFMCRISVDSFCVLSKMSLLK